MKQKYGWLLFLIGLVLFAISMGWLTRTLRLAHLRSRFSLSSSSTQTSVLVDFRDGLTVSERQAWAQKWHVTTTPVSQTENAEAVYEIVVPGSLEQAQHVVEEMRKGQEVETADVNWTYSIPEQSPEALTKPQEEGLHDNLVARSLQTPPSASSERMIPNDPRYPTQWHMHQINMPEAWAKAMGEGVVVAVIDTGVTQVEDLQGTKMVPGWNFVDDNADARDDHGHGTHVAGTIAQTTNNHIGVAGVAPKAQIMPIKVLSAGGSGSLGGIVAGIRWAVDHGAKVINMSLGGPYYSEALAKAVRYAHNKGVVVVCAAGNDGRGRVSYPAANPGAIAVAATQFDESTTFYSNWGKEIAIAAPGGNTRVDQNNDGVPDGVLQNTVVPGQTHKQDYLLFMGTSMASPHVAGVAALLYGAGAHDPDQILKLMQDSARKPQQYQGKKDPHYGAGIVNAAAALRQALWQPPSAYDLMPYAEDDCLSGYECPGGSHW